MAATWNAPNLACPVCRGVFPPGASSRGEPFPCPACRRTIEAEVFPALFRPLTEGAGASRAVGGGAVCFYHPEHTAQAPCDTCGRFLCALCDLPLANGHHCPVCVENLARKPTENPWTSHRLLWGRAALLIAVVPFVAYPITFLTFLTAPLAVILAALWWKKPGSVTGAGKLSLVLAILFGIAQILLWVAVLMWLVGVVGDRFEPSGEAMSE